MKLCLSFRRQVGNPSLPPPPDSDPLTSVSHLSNAQLLNNPKPSTSAQLWNLPSEIILEIVDHLSDGGLELGLFLCNTHHQGVRFLFDPFTASRQRYNNLSHLCHFEGYERHDTALSVQHNGD